MTLSNNERRLLEKLAAEGKATRLLAEELEVAKSLEIDGLLFLIGKGEYAIITPKGRRLLADLALPQKPKPPKPPFGFLE